MNKYKMNLNVQLYTQTIYCYKSFVLNNAFIISGKYEQF